MKHEATINLIDLVSCLSDAMDYIDPTIVNHHRQVAYISFCLGMEMALSPKAMKDLVLAGALHDIGAFSLKDRLDTFNFEILNGPRHAETGYSLLKSFAPLANAAVMVRYHHLPWEKHDSAGNGHKDVPLGSFILNLADRIAVQVDTQKEVLGQAPEIMRRISQHAGTLFMPDVFDAFLTLSGKEYFWLNLVDPPMNLIDMDQVPEVSFEVGSESMLNFSRLFSRIIDFKSSFTATHSSGVAASSEQLARLSGFADEDCVLMRIAGYLHDLGKLAVPVEILNKPASLHALERNVIRHHSFYTYRILQTVPALQTINKWGAFHHERLDGRGYPFHLTARDLPLGSQIMAVADVFTAITEDRPYRAGMTEHGAMKVLQDMSRDHALNSDIVSLLASHYKEINSVRNDAQAAANMEYSQLRAAEQ